MHAHTHLLLSVFALVATASPVAGGGALAPGGFVYRQVKVGHERRLYAVWLPPGYDASKRWPAVVFLHGSGECGTDGEKPTRAGLGPALEAHPERWPFVVVFPQKPREDQEWEEREAIVLAVLREATKHFAIDEARVALVGVSQGGHGAWYLGARSPERWRCLVPVCGYGRARTVGPRVAKLPVWAFHGLRDDLVDPNDTRRIIAGIRAERTRLGLDPDGARMTLFPEANHNSWDAAFAHDSLAVWLREQLRAK